MRPRLWVICGLLPALLANAAASPVLPWTGRDAAPGSSEEKSLWVEADEFDRAFARAGKLNLDPQLAAYVQGIMDRLYPEFRDRFRVHVINGQQINAFALPNGSVYVNSGLIARFQNEAQLATVLGHEGAHFVHRHSLQQNEQVKSSAAFSLVVAMLGVPLVGDLVALSSMFGYSREHEREADQVGYQRLVAAGYDAREGVRTFEHLLAESKASEIKEPFFFADHPKLKERIESFRELSKDAQGGWVGREEFLRATAGLRLASFEADLAAYRNKQVILVLADSERRQEYPPEASFYLGEAYRQRNAPGDNDKAEQQYRIAIDGAPQFAPPYRALGLIYYRRSDMAHAAPLFRRYLELAPQASDREYVEAYLTQSTPAQPGPQP